MFPVAQESHILLRSLASRRIAARKRQAQVAATAHFAPLAVEHIADTADTPPAQAR
ncbi:hypothetical protein L247_18580 [Salmonella enterica subsp. enterica serovar Worthington str. BCH-7253]|nr:hypothetical protein L247_18580 [Salmonella enterica subsp. enterica serovar Worthington str. BCH-7253]